MKSLSTLIISEIPIYAFSQTASVILCWGAERNQLEQADKPIGSGIASINPFAFNSIAVNVPHKNVNTFSKRQVSSGQPQRATLCLATNQLSTASKISCDRHSTALQNNPNVGTGAERTSNRASYVLARAEAIEGES